jgi:hypothetical protein
MTFGILKRHWFVFSGIFLIYLVLSVLLVKGLGNVVDVTGVRQEAEAAFAGGFAQLVSGMAVVGTLFSEGNSPATDASGAYQSILLVLFSLVFIWALRQLQAGEKITIRDAFYKGSYPLVPFLLVLLVIALQMLPALAASYMYQLAFVQGLAVTGVEMFLWGALVFLLILWSIYMVTSSVFALYIVTLPDMRPMQALRSARELARFRRWAVTRKVLFLPIAIFVVIILIMFPVVMFIPVLAEWLFYVLTLGSLAIIHVYMYTLYRELLK